MHITHAEFVLGATHPRQFPADPLPELAFAGRSNCGKSTLLNRLLGRKGLARVSRTPGCTREINYFRINRIWWFVDLPGYGYARVGRQQRQDWDRELGGYVAKRRELRAVILLMDLRRGVTDLDREMIAFLEGHGVPWLPVATKADKLGSNPRRQALRQMISDLEAVGRLAVAPPVACSSLTGAGLPELRNQLRALLEPVGGPLPAPSPPATPAVE